MGKMATTELLVRRVPPETMDRTATTVLLDRRELTAALVRPENQANEELKGKLVETGSMECLPQIKV